MKINDIHLRTNDLLETKKFYETVLGLVTHKQTENELVLGNASPLLYFHQDNKYQGKPNQFTGLYHFALLLQSDQDLASLLYHFIENQYPIIGAADHLYSKAVYLQETNGYGIEVYADRPKTSWIIENEYIKSDTLPLDIESLLEKRTRQWTQLPDTASIGHIHLQTNDLFEANILYVEKLGLKEMSLVPSALFLSDHDYHHDIALNAWNRQIKPPQEDSLAMLYFTIEAIDFDPDKLKDYLITESKTTYHYQDKSGIQFKIIKKIQD